MCSIPQLGDVACHQSATRDPRLVVHLMARFVEDIVGYEQCLSMLEPLIGRNPVSKPKPERADFPDYVRALQGLL
jgi:hypothetical protein